MIPKELSRRTVLKSSASLAAAAVLAGCSKNDSDNVYMGGSGEVFTEERLTYSSHYGCASHNCGGACSLQIHVKDGKVKRILTDEKAPDMAMNEGDDPQRRACVRCRSKSTWFYRSDRILYPLKQMGERGDPKGFVAITWEQANKEIAEKARELVNTYGPECIFPHYCSADGSAFPSGAGMPIGFCHAMAQADAVAAGTVTGGFNHYRFDYSFVNYMYIWNFFNGHPEDGAVSIFFTGNSRQDIVNSEALLMWGHNVCENIWGTNSQYYVKQAKDKGVKMYFVDQRYSRTANILADKVLTPVAGTDTAILLGMIYHMLDHDFNTPGVEKWLDYDFLKKTVFGFFDEPAPVSYNSANNSGAQMKNNYGCPAGASLSAYVLGDEDWLTAGGGNPGFNLDTSLYPDEIGYNVNSDDPLYSEFAPIYGQIPKTPEWAEAISGVPAAQIRELAEQVATKKTFLFFGGSMHRNSEGEQIAWLVCALMAITGNFGGNGRSTAFTMDRSTVPGPYFAGIEGISLADKKKYFSTSWNARYKDDVPSFPQLIASLNKYSLSMATWIDAVDHSNVDSSHLNNDPAKPKYHCTGSKWNDPQVRSGSPIKFILNNGGNMITNQCGDYHEAVRIMGDRSKCELIVTQDPFMSPSALYSDYVLPAALPFERAQLNANWVGGGESAHYTKQVLDRPGEVKADYEIMAGILKEYSEAAYNMYTDGGKSVEQRIEEGLNWAAEAYGAPELKFENMEKEGLVRLSSYGRDENDNDNIFVRFQDFRSDPSSNPLNTPTGRFEVYSQLMIEDYEARGHDNDDVSGTLPRAIPTNTNANNNNRRYVYPIPMYIPLIEGSHDCDAHNEYAKVTGVPLFTAGGAIDKTDHFGATQHPDLLGKNADGYKFRLVNWHMMYRSHSTINNNGYLNEFYKRDRDGEAAFSSGDKPVTQVWEDNVYETAWMNKTQAERMEFRQGDLAIISSTQGHIMVSLELSESIRPYTVMIGEGAWTYMRSGVDVGGNPNTLITQRVSRINKGNCLSNDTRVSIKHINRVD